MNIPKCQAQEFIINGVSLIKFKWKIITVVMWILKIYFWQYVKDKWEAEETEIKVAWAEEAWVCSGSKDRGERVEKTGLKRIGLDDKGE